MESVTDMSALQSSFVSSTPAGLLNQNCFCITLDRGHDSVLGRHGQMFADVPVFVSEIAWHRMKALVAGVEAATRLPAFREQALARHPDLARSDRGPLGVLMGFDFHVEDDEVALIEINTNAGGAALNWIGLEAQRACCPEVASQMRPGLTDFPASVVSMFVDEWRRQRGEGRPRRIAIVDDAPEDQFLYPEFELFQGMLEDAGFETIIVSPADLRFENGQLLGAGQPVDLVYNRLVDFMLTERGHEVLRFAYEAGAVVVTPNPHAYALYADKRNLIVLSNPEAPALLELAPEFRDALSVIPRTIAATPTLADDLWTSRRDWYFKPATGHGSKAVYRGDKLTRGTWTQILAGDYVAQAVAPPGRRTVQLADGNASHKVYIRLYVYAGRVLLAAARLYQGQTTNFRTPGGGFAPVYVVEK